MGHPAHCITNNKTSLYMKRQITAAPQTVGRRFFAPKVSEPQHNPSAMAMQLQSNLPAARIHTGGPPYQPLCRIQEPRVPSDNRSQSRQQTKCRRAEKQRSY